MPPFRFSPDALAELRQLGHDDALIAALEVSAARYREHAACSRRIAERDIPRAQRELATIHKQAASLLQTLDAAHPIVQIATRPYRVAIEALARRSPVKSTRPTDHDRHDLEYGIAHTLNAHGIPLATTPTGKLGATLAIILAAVRDDGVAPDTDRLKQICSRVKKELRERLAAG
jgi:hypothetical protein